MIKPDSKISALLLLFLLSGAYIKTAPAAEPGENNMRGAIINLLKLEELLGPKAKPLQHAVVGQAPDTQPPAPPVPPHISAPTKPTPYPDSTKDALKANTHQELAQTQPSTRPTPINPATKGQPAIGIKKAVPQDSRQEEKNKDTINGLLPDLKQQLSAPKPKSKIKRVTTPKQSGSH